MIRSNEKNPFMLTVVGLEMYKYNCIKQLLTLVLKLQ